MILEKGGEMICGHIRQAPYTDTVMWALRCLQCAVIRIWSGHFMHTHTRPTHMQIVAHMHAGRHRKECGKRLNNKYTRTHCFRPFIYTSNAIYNTIQQSKRIVILNGHISASLSFFFFSSFCCCSWVCVEWCMRASSSSRSNAANFIYGFSVWVSCVELDFRSMGSPHYKQAQTARIGSMAKWPCMRNMLRLKQKLAFGNDDGWMRMSQCLWNERMGECTPCVMRNKKGHSRV